MKNSLILIALLIPAMSFAKVEVKTHTSTYVCNGNVDGYLLTVRGTSVTYTDISRGGTDMLNATSDTEAGLITLSQGLKTVLAFTAPLKASNAGRWSGLSLEDYKGTNGNGIKDLRKFIRQEIGKEANLWVMTTNADDHEEIFLSVDNKTYKFADCQ